MDRVYTDSVCDICKLSPSMGWLYVCRKDSNSPNLMCHDFPKPTHSKVPREINNEDEDENGDLSPSIVKQVESGLFTDQQINLMKQQKRHLRDIIKLEESPQQQEIEVSGHKKRRSASLLPLIIDESLSFPSVCINDGQIESYSVEGKGGASSEQGRKSKRRKQCSPCRFQCCHGCRPYFRDKIYSSFDAVWNNEYPPIEPWEISLLRISDAKLIRNIGTRPNPQWIALPMHSASSTVGTGSLVEGEEIEVPGGVALTEEAVKSQTPDIISHR